MPPAPSTPADLLSRARVCALRGDVPNGQALAERALAGALAAHEAACGVDAAILLAKMAINAEQRDHAQRWVRQAMALNPGGRHGRGRLAVSWVLWSDLQTDAGHAHEAARGIQRAMALLEGDVPVLDRQDCLSGIGVLHGRHGMQIQACAAYRQAWRLVDAAGLDAAGRYKALVNLIAGVWQLVEVQRHADIGPAQPLLTEAQVLLEQLRLLAAGLDTAHAWHGYRYFAAALAWVQADPAHAAHHLGRLLSSDAPMPAMLRLDALLLRARLEQHAAGAAQAATLAALTPMLPPPTRSRSYWDILRHLGHAQVRGDADAIALWAMRGQALLARHAQALLDVRMALHGTDTMAEALRVEARALRDGHHGLIATRRELEQQANHDVLTGLPNRRALHGAHEALRSGPGVLMLLDLDHFKRVNDRFGHRTGDAVLCAVAQQLRQAVREGDCVARLGGEEFALLLPGATLAGAGHTIARIRELLAAHDWQPLLQGGAITLSGGAVALRPHDALEAALRRADALLYAAKHAGRDRILLQEPGDA